MTMYEMNFSLLVEDTLKNIVLPEYRQIIVEVVGPFVMRFPPSKRNFYSVAHVFFCLCLSSC